MQRMADQPRPKLRERIRQLRMAFSATRQVDPKLLPLLIGVPLATLVVFVLLGVLIGRPVFAIVVGVLFAVLAALLVFGRRATNAQMAAIEGRPGAAAAVLQSMRGPWIVTPAVAFTRKQDFVHRVVGRPGVIMVGEGARARVASLLKQESRRVARAVGDVAVHEVSVGDGEGQVPLGKLQTHLQKLPRAMKAREVGPLERRLAALKDQNLPIPKGPPPRPPRGKQR
jgi:hypothetical protein